MGSCAHAPALSARCRSARCKQRGSQQESDAAVALLLRESGPALPGNSCRTDRPQLSIAQWERVREIAHAHAGELGADYLTRCADMAKVDLDEAAAASAAVLATKPADYAARVAACEAALEAFGPADSDADLRRAAAVAMTECWPVPLEVATHWRHRWPNAQQCVRKVVAQAVKRAAAGRQSANTHSVPQRPLCLACAINRRLRRSRPLSPFGTSCPPPAGTPRAARFTLASSSRWPRAGRLTPSRARCGSSWRRRDSMRSGGSGAAAPLVGIALSRSFLASRGRSSCRSNPSRCARSPPSL